MAKISDYINTRTGFAANDLFDVSATDDGGTSYESQKTTWANLKTQLNSELSFLSSGDNISSLTNDAGYVTTDTNFENTSLVFTSDRIHNLGGFTVRMSTGVFRIDELHVGDIATTGYGFPTAVGTLGQVLEVNASGDLVFATPSGGAGNTIYSADDTVAANRTLSSGADANHMTLNVGTGNTGFGVAIASITDKLHVGGTFRADGRINIQQGSSVSYLNGSAGSGFRFGTGSTVDSLGVFTVQCSNATGAGGFVTGQTGDSKAAFWSNIATNNFGSQSAHDLTIWRNAATIGGYIRHSNGQLAWGFSGASLTSEKMELEGTYAFRNTTTPAVTVGTTKLFAVNSSDGTSALGIRCEQAVEAIGTFTPSNKLKIEINGVEYWIQLDAV